MSEPRFSVEPSGSGFAVANSGESELSVFVRPWFKHRADADQCASEANRLGKIPPDTFRIGPDDTIEIEAAGL